MALLSLFYFQSISCIYSFRDGGDTVIPLSNFKMDHLQVIYDFFYALRDHPPREKSAVKDSDDTYAQQSGSAHAVENDGDESVNGKN